MRKQASINFQPGHLSEAAMAASRQVWLAGLGAAVVTRDWVQNDAGTMLKSLVREGTAVESRAIRFVGDQLEGSVTRVNSLWRRTRHNVETTVRSCGDSAATIVRETLPRTLPMVDLPLMKKAQARGKRAAAAKRARKAAAPRTTKAVGAAKRSTKKAAAKAV